MTIRAFNLKRTETSSYEKIKLKYCIARNCWDAFKYVYCCHGESTTICCMVLTDSCTRPLCDAVSFKELRVPPPSYFLQNTNWSVVVCCHYFSVILHTTDQSDERSHTSSLLSVRSAVFGGFLSKCFHASTSKPLIYSQSGDSAPPRSRQMDRQPPHWWPHGDSRPPERGFTTNTF